MRVALEVQTRPGRRTISHLLTAAASSRLYPVSQGGLFGHVVRKIRGRVAPADRRQGDFAGRVAGRLPDADRSGESGGERLCRTRFRRGGGSGARGRKSGSARRGAGAAAWVAAGGEGSVRDGGAAH